MTEKDLINNLKQLKKVQPRKEWAVFTKQEILGIQENISVFSFILRHKPAFASVSLFCFIIALTVLSYNALPGDVLFPIRKTTEKIELSTKIDQVQSLAIAQRRLEDLKKAQEKAEKNMGPAISEMQNSMSQATKIALKSQEKLVVQQVIDIDNEIKSLGVLIENQEIEQLYKREVELEIERIKQLSLTLEQTEMLEKAIELFDQEQYAEAYLMILELSS
ncbi:MAG: hypothetical protein PHN37_01945 [Candidatus Pacebacteria bacterium]|nr:hypothetical protein [Candidatus Paceibacterota bacterium]